MSLGTPAALTGVLSGSGTAFRTSAITVNVERKGPVAVVVSQKLGSWCICSTRESVKTDAVNTIGSLVPFLLRDETLELGHGQAASSSSETPWDVDCPTLRA